MPFDMSSEKNFPQKLSDDHSTRNAHWHFSTQISTPYTIVSLTIPMPKTILDAKNAKRECDYYHICVQMYA